jgi:hypothetical protein
LEDVLLPVLSYAVALVVVLVLDVELDELEVLVLSDLDEVFEVLLVLEELSS